MNLIAAVDNNLGIGKDGKLLFQIPGDMKFFRDTTIGNVVVMGRKTLESFPGGRPLKGRVNIVLTHDKNYEVEGVIVVHNLEDLLEKLNAYDKKKIFVIGGESIYKLLLPYCKVAYITKINAERDADTFFPNLDDDWIITHTSEDNMYFDLEYKFVKYEKFV